MVFGDVVSLPPALHSRVIEVAERPRDGPNAATLAEDLLVGHPVPVRPFRTPVKGVVSVPEICDFVLMADGKTTGERLIALKARADMSLIQIAKAADYAGKSSIQEYFRETYEGPLGTRAALKIAGALEGRGQPPIARDEVLALTSVLPASNVSDIFRFEGSSMERSRENLPVYGTALGAEKIVDGEAIEQTTLNRGEIERYVKRPPILNGVAGVYGLHVQGSSMEPIHLDGALLIVRKSDSLRAEDDVVVYMRPQDESDDGERATSVLVKRLVRRTAQYVELKQFEPAKTFRIAAADVLRIDKVLRVEDILE